jgi:hypothetical protein
MDNMMAFAKGMANQGKELMVFDWEKAAKLIKEKQPQEAGAGLAGDWSWTGGEIWRDDKPVPKEDTYTYLASTWAIPELEMDGSRQDCYKMQSDTPKWDSGTYWPEEALKIIKEVNQDES